MLCLAHTPTHINAASLAGGRWALHVPAQSDVSGQQVAHGNHTRHDHHGEAQPVKKTQGVRGLFTVVFMRMCAGTGRRFQKMLVFCPLFIQSGVDK